MNRVHKISGQIAWRILWPWLWIYLHNSYRTRLLITCDNKVLVVKSWLSDGRWGLPGGGLHKNENSIDGALRELKEETNITLKQANLKLIGQFIYSNHGFRFNYDLYRVNLSSLLPIKCQMGEIVDAKWIDVETLKPRNSGPDLLQSLTYF